MKKQALLIHSFWPARMGLPLLAFTPVFGKSRLAGGAPSQKTTRRIMIVDDERDISAIFKSGLERNGFAVDVFNDPGQALAHFKPDQYDLLLLDVKMPEISGFELWAKIKKLDKKAKVCFVSAYEAQEEELKRYLPDEAEKCIVKKPVSMNDLVNAINKELSDTKP